MLKRVLITVALGFMLVLSGCGSSDGEAETALETQQMLDDGEYEGVIAKLESSADSISDYLSLGAAYMGKAGFSLSSIIGIVATSADNEDDGAFASFIESSKAASNNQSLADLKTAVNYYQKVVANKCVDENSTLSGAEADLCLYVGLSKVSQTAVAMSYIADDVSVLSDNNSEGSDDKLTASTCAMQYAFDGAQSNAECTFGRESSVTFMQSEKTYGSIDITVNGKIFEYLISGSQDPRSTALTKGFCSLTDFTTRVDETDDATYHACPVDESSTISQDEETTTEEVIVDALNNGTDSIGVAVNEDMKEDIDTLKEDILKANGRSINDANTTISTEDFIKYLETNN